MKKTLIFIIFIFAVGSILFLIRENSSKNEREATESAQYFGLALQRVSLSADPNILRESILKEYAPYITTELLNEWIENPKIAPGRFTSSPWPDHIDVINIHKIMDGPGYVINGEVILMTSNEVEHGGNAGKIPVSLTIVPVDGKWLISEFNWSIK